MEVESYEEQEEEEEHSTVSLYLLGTIQGGLSLNMQIAVQAQSCGIRMKQAHPVQLSLSVLLSKS